MEREWDAAHVKMSDSESVKAFVKGGRRELIGEKNREGASKTKRRLEGTGGRVMAGRSWATLASVGREGRRKPPPP